LLIGLLAGLPPPASALSLSAGGEIDERGLDEGGERDI